MLPEKQVPPVVRVPGPVHPEAISNPLRGAGNWQGEAEDSGGLYRHWQTFLRHKGSILICLLLGGLGGFAVFVPTAPRYAASSTIEIQPVNGNFMGAVDPFSTGFSDISLQAQTQISIIRSASRIGPAVERMQRESSALVAPPADTFSGLRNRLGLTPKEPVQIFNNALSIALETLSVRLVPGTRIIQISCESTVPDVAANFINALVSEYQYQSQQTRSTNSQKTSQWLGAQLEETKARLNTAERELEDFVRRSGNLFAAETETLSSSKLKQIQNDLAIVQTERVNKQTLYEMSLTRPVETFPPEFSFRINEYDNEIIKLQQQLAQLETTLTPNHYKVKQVQAQIAELQDARERERKNILARIKGDYEQALNREKLLANEYSRQAGAVSGEADKAAQYGILKREVDILKQTLNGLLAQSNQTSVASAVPVQSSVVVDFAKPGGAPTSPVLWRYLMTGLVLGGVGGYVIALTRDSLRNKRIHDRFGAPGYASRVLNVPELGVIPSAALEIGSSASRLVRRWKSAEIVVSADTEANQPVELVTWKEKPSLLAESFRLTLASLTVRDSNGAPPVIVVVTSPGPGEGKTTVATNIAIARAETNRKVLLLETDLRKPRLANLFRLSNPHGWSDLILSDQDFQAEQIERLVQPTDIPGLFALRGGTIAPPLIHQLFNSPKIPRLLVALRRLFDMIVIDTPPLLHFPEARLIGRLSDGVILVLRSNHTDRSAALLAQERLWEDGIPILGTVLNDWNPKDGHDPLYSGYYRAHYRYYAAETN